MVRTKHRVNKRKRKYNVIPYTFDDDGKKQKKLMRVPLNCVFLKRVRYGGSLKDMPDTHNGQKVYGWVYMYSADDQEGDEWSPIVVRIKKQGKNTTIWTKIVKLFRY